MMAFKYISLCVHLRHCHSGIMHFGFSRFSTSKEWLFLLLLCTPLILAKDELYLEVKAFNSSTVELSCNYIGNKNDITFDVHKNQYACLHQAYDRCNPQQQKHCNIDCENPRDPKAVSFMVNFNGDCEDYFSIKCIVRSRKEKPRLHMVKSIDLTAPSDSPKILVNNGQQVYADSKPVPVACTVTNMCNETEVKISGDLHMKPPSISHTKQGSRFTTTVKTTAIFHEPGSYNIICQEAGKGSHFSTVQSVAVIERHDKIIEPCLMEEGSISLKCTTENGQSTTKTVTIVAEEIRMSEENGSTGIMKWIAIALSILLLMTCFASWKRILKFLQRIPNERRNENQKDGTQLLLEQNRTDKEKKVPEENVPMARGRHDSSTIDISEDQDLREEADLLPKERQNPSTLPPSKVKDIQEESVFMDSESELDKQRLSLLAWQWGVKPADIPKELRQRKKGKQQENKAEDN